MPRPFEDFEIGHDYSLHEDMWPASRGFGTFHGGIQPKGVFPNTEAVVVLAEVGGGPYGDRWDEDELVYQGENDRWGDSPSSTNQSLDKGNNRVLALQPETKVPLYLFTKSEEDVRWTYEGLALVTKASTVWREPRLIVEFRILPLDIPSEADLVAIEEQVTRSWREPPELTNRDTRLSKAARKVRSLSFSRRVKRNYSHRCAVCGASRFDAWERPEVQAAHIFPREEDGADDPRNGLGLCTFHHWAFDGGLFLLDEELRTRVTEPGLAVEELRILDGQRLRVLLASPEERPHPIYVRARLRLPKYSDLVQERSA